MPETIDLDTIHLAGGSHELRDPRCMCLLEACAYVAGGPHSMCPPQVEPALAHWGRVINDSIDELPRQRLKPLIPAMVATGCDDLGPRRDQMVFTWLWCVNAASWISVAGFDEIADELNRADTTNLRRLHKIVGRARTTVYAQGREHLCAYYRAIDDLIEHPHDATTLNVARMLAAAAARAHVAIAVTRLTPLSPSTMSIGGYLMPTRLCTTVLDSLTRLPGHAGHHILDIHRGPLSDTIHMTLNTQVEDLSDTLIDLLHNLTEITA